MIASGYEAQCWLRQRVAKNLGSYAYINDPVDPAELRWLASTLLWESALRSTGDGWLLVGGEDDDRKATTLQRKVSRLFPHLHAQPAFAWVGVWVSVIIDPAEMCGVFLPKTCPKNDSAYVRHRTDHASSFHYIGSGSLALPLHESRVRGRTPPESSSGGRLMNKNQVKGHANEAKGKVKEVAGKVTGDKRMEYKGKAEKHGGKAEAKYGDLKSDTKKATK